MKSKIDNYSENLNVFSIVKDKLNDAILNAKQLEKYQMENEKQPNNEKCNPYTGIYRIVEDLMERRVK